MGRGACQLGRTAGVETGEEESGGSISGGGRERTWEKKWRFVATTSAMRELRQGFFWAFDAMWEVQSGEILYADVSGRSLQRAQVRMSSHRYSFKEWFGDEIERFFDQSTPLPCANRLQLPLKKPLWPSTGRISFWHCELLLTCMLSRPVILRLSRMQLPGYFSPASRYLPAVPSSTLRRVSRAVYCNGSHTACITLRITTVNASFLAFCSLSRAISTPVVLEIATPDPRRKAPSLIPSAMSIFST